MTNCQNCGTELLGPHCYKCGQPIKGLVRHFGSIIGDFFDSVFDLDARMPRTVWPLLARPGFLSREYFEGRRVRYVSPVRLFFFLSIVTFFVAQFALGASDAININTNTDASVAAQIADEQRDARAERLKAESEQKAESPPGSIDEEIRFNDKPWDPVTNPVTVSWLPAFANTWINKQVARGRDNVKEMQETPERFKNAVLSALPSTLFILLPLFAAMLKVAYLFKRRLYMEHLIVALHSHAFLCLAVLLALLLSMLGDAVPALSTPVGWAEALLLLWMPLYLLLMQKRVYGQGWIMTVLKYCVIGICYSILLSFGVAATILFSLVWG